MHPRNRYRDNRPDFYQLAQHRPSLSPYLLAKKTKASTGTCEGHPSPTHSHTLDFSDPNALRELACALLSRDFCLEVVLPEDRLVPMVPQRLNYVHWLEDLLLRDGGQEGREQGGEREAEGEQVFGIDIGTGASCIYPLLGTAMHPNWYFLATETDNTSVESAASNVRKNNLQERIKVIKVTEDVVLVGAISSGQHYHFVMCNPPFFTDNRERVEGAQRTEHRPAPPTFNTGCEGETVTEGGELGFVRRIIHDSLILRTQITWYTSMLGKKSSVKTICQELKQHQVPVVTSTRFVQGKTHRWAVAWSFDENLAHRREDDSLEVSKKYRKHSHPLTLSVVCGEEAAEVALEKVLSQLHTALTELKIEIKEEEGEGEEEREKGEEKGPGRGRQLVCEARRNTWSQQRKRRRLRQRLQQLVTLKSGGSQVNTGLTQQEGGSKVSEAEPEAEGIVTVSGNSRGLDKEKGRGKVDGICGESSVCDVDKQDSPEQVTRGGHAQSSLLSPDSEQLLRGEEGKQQTEDTSEAQGSEAGDIQQQIEALSSPCYAQFSCTACVSSSAQPLVPPRGKKKRATLSTTETAASHRENTISLIFEWIEGDSKDLLYQIIQYLKNTTFKDSY